MTWRGWLGFAGSASAITLDYRGRWLLAGLVGAGVMVLAGWWLGGELAAARALLRESPQPPAGRHRKPGEFRELVVYWATRAAQVPLP